MAHTTEEIAAIAKGLSTAEAYWLNATPQRRYERLPDAVNLLSAKGLVDTFPRAAGWAFGRSSLGEQVRAHLTGASQ